MRACPRVLMRSHALCGGRPGCTRLERSPSPVWRVYYKHSKLSNIAGLHALWPACSSAPGKDRQPQGPISAQVMSACGAARGRAPCARARRGCSGAAFLRAVISAAAAGGSARSRCASGSDAGPASGAGARAHSSAARPRRAQVRRKLNQQRPRSRPHASFGIQKHAGKERALSQGSAAFRDHMPHANSVNVAQLPRLEHPGRRASTGDSSYPAAACSCKCSHPPSQPSCPACPQRLGGRARCRPRRGAPGVSGVTCVNARSPQGAPGAGARARMPAGSGPGAHAAMAPARARPGHVQPSSSMARAALHMQARSRAAPASAGARASAAPWRLGCVLPRPCAPACSSRCCRRTTSCPPGQGRQHGSRPMERLRAERLLDGPAWPGGAPSWAARARPSHAPHVASRHKRPAARVAAPLQRSRILPVRQARASVLGAGLSTGTHEPGSSKCEPASRANKVQLQASWTPQPRVVPSTMHCWHLQLTSSLRSHTDSRERSREKSCTDSGTKNLYNVRPHMSHQRAYNTAFHMRPQQL
jgi:hypothetical protein